MKKLFSLCIAIGIIALLVSAFKNYSDGTKKGIDLANFDTTIKPQQDFFHYVNGTWLKNNPIPPSEGAWGSFNILNDSNLSRLRKILEDVAADKNAAPGSIEQKVGDYYSMIMDSNKLNKDGITPLNDEFKRIDAISDNKSLWAEAAHLSLIGPDVMFGFGVTQDSKISTKEVCHLSQAGIGLPTKEYYLDTTSDMKMIRAAYVDYLKQLFLQMNQAADQAQKSAQKVMGIETQMAKSCRTPVQLRNPVANYNKMFFSDFEKMTPGIDWDASLQVFGVKSVDTVVVGQPEFMKNISEMAKSVSLDDWKLYLRCHLLDEEAGKLSDTIAKIHFAFWSTTLQGIKEMQPRWKRAVESTSGSLGQLVGQLYIKKYFSPEAKAKVKEMVGNIIAAYKDRISQLSWMSPETKTNALNKLDRIMLKLCYPDKWKDYSTMEIKRDAFVLNSFRVNKWESDYDINKLGKPVDRTEWGMSPQTVNAYYNPRMNEIVFPAAIMQPPFFDPNRDDAMNYGGIGGVIGHELTHGFDDNGAQFDANGNLHKWWTKEDSAHYYGKLQLLIQQFDGYTIDSAHVNGHLTIGENTADLGGLTISYYALQKDLKEHPEGVIDGFTPEQRFFISWAEGWRMNIRPAMARRRVKSDPHSPAIFRVNGPLADMEEFYKAFDVKPGDALYKAPDQRAVIW
jgi:putative endopeptidase